METKGNIAKVIAITNQKGGVGKSTSAQAVAIIAANVFKKKVLVIDTDQQANTSKFFIRDKRDTSANEIFNRMHEYSPNAINKEDITISNLLMNQNQIEDAIKHTEHDKLDIITADINLNIAKRYITSSANYLKKIIAPILGKYDLIIFDTPPATDNILANVLNAVEMCYIPVQLEIQSIDGMMQTVDFINQLSGLDNKNLDYRIFITMFDRRISMHKELEKVLYTINDNPAEIFQYIPGEHMSPVVLRNQTAVIENSTSTKNFSLIKSSKRSKLADEYLNLTKEILGGV